MSYFTIDIYNSIPLWYVLWTWYWWSGIVEMTKGFSITDLYSQNVLQNLMLLLIINKPNQTQAETVSQYA